MVKPTKAFCTSDLCIEMIGFCMDKNFYLLCSYDILHKMSRKVNILGSVAKNMAFLQNQCRPSQLGKLINLIAGKKVHKDKNRSIKLWKYYFCTTNALSSIHN